MAGLKPENHKVSTTKGFINRHKVRKFFNSNGRQVQEGFLDMLEMHVKVKLDIALVTYYKGPDYNRRKAINVGVGQMISLQDY